MMKLEKKFNYTKRSKTIVMKRMRVKIKINKSANKKSQLEG